MREWETVTELDREIDAETLGDADCDDDRLAEALADALAEVDTEALDDGEALLVKDEEREGELEDHAGEELGAGSRVEVDEMGCFDKRQGGQADTPGHVGSEHHNHERTGEDHDPVVELARRGNLALLARFLDPLLCRIFGFL